MTTQAALTQRLRRLIDDIGHGYSQSAPGFATDLSAVTNPSLGLQLDADLTPSDISLGDPASLKTGQAIAAAMQSAIRALYPDRTGWSNCVVSFDRKDGYVLRSGTTGSNSNVRVVPPTAGDDAAATLKLGKANGGYETLPRVSMTDDELGELLDQALAIQNEVGSPTNWTYSTVPPSYDTILVYRAWASVIDIKLGQSASWHWQRVEAEENHEEQIFSNYMKLADWLKKKIDDLQIEIDGGIEVSTCSRFDLADQQFVPTETHTDQKMRAAILTASWLDASTAVLELGEILSTGFTEINVGYRLDTPGVIDRAIYNDPNYESQYSKTKGFVSPSVLARTIRNGRNTMLRISGLDQTKDTYFAALAIDVDGIRYFSNELLLPATP